MGENTKNLYRFVRWEIDLVLELRLPIVVVNLNGLRRMDSDRCPALLRDKDAVHVSFNVAIIRHALDRFTSEHVLHRLERRGPRHDEEGVYAGLGL